jgi:putative transposase
MAGREEPLVTGEYYHVYNRGVAKLPTFIADQDYQQAMLDLNYYRFIKPPIKFSRFKRLNLQGKTELFAKLEKSGYKLVNIVGFVLMPNHFHFLLKQVADDGIARYLSLFTNSYTRYFNTRNKGLVLCFKDLLKRYA